MDGGSGATYGDGKVVAASELGNLAGVPERRAHDDGLVAVLLVVVEDGLDGGHTGVVLLGVLLLLGGLEPVEDAADEGRDEEGAGLGGGDGLDEREHEGEVAVDAVVALEDLGGLDALPGGGDLDEDAVLGDTLLLVELQTGPALAARSDLRIRTDGEKCPPYLDDLEGLVDGGLGVERQVGVDLGGDLAGDDLEDLGAELDQEAVERELDLLLSRAALALGVRDGLVDQGRVLGLLGGGEDEGGVGRRVLGLVLADGWRGVSRRSGGGWRAARRGL